MVPYDIPQKSNYSLPPHLAAHGTFENFLSIIASRSSVSTQLPRCSTATYILFAFTLYVTSIASSNIYTTCRLEWSQQTVTCYMMQMYNINIFLLTLNWKKCKSKHIELNYHIWLKAYSFYSWNMYSLMITNVYTERIFSLFDETWYYNHFMMNRNWYMKTVD